MDEKKFLDILDKISKRFLAPGQGGKASDLDEVHVIFDMGDSWDELVVQFAFPFGVSKSVAARQLGKDMIHSAKENHTPRSEVDVVVMILDAYMRMTPISEDVSFGDGKFSKLYDESRVSEYTTLLVCGKSREGMSANVIMPYEEGADGSRSFIIDEIILDFSVVGKNTNPILTQFFEGGM
jgi:hypothetical protein